MSYYFAASPPVVSSTALTSALTASVSGSTTLDGLSLASVAAPSSSTSSSSSSFSSRVRTGADTEGFTGSTASAPSSSLREALPSITASAILLTSSLIDRKSTRLNSSHANISYA